MRMFGVWDGSPANDNATSGGEARPVVVDVVVAFGPTCPRGSSAQPGVVLVRAEGCVRRRGARGPAVRS